MADQSPPIAQATVVAADIRDREQPLSASITLDSPADLDQLFLEYQSARVDFHQPLREDPWGARTFIVRDPDNNLLLFAAPAMSTVDPVEG